MLSKKTRYYIRFYLLTALLCPVVLPLLLLYILTYYTGMRKTADRIMDQLKGFLSWRDFKMDVYRDILVNGFALVVKVKR